MSTVNIALLEHTNFRTATQFAHKVFRKLGHDANIIELHAGTVAMGGSKSVFEQQPIDVFISDLSLGKTTSSNYEGLHYIQQVKKLYPDIFTIGISQQDLSYYTAAAKLPSFDLFVQKDLVDDEKYLNHIITLLQQNFRRNVSVALDVGASTLLKEHSTLREQNKLERILRAVTFTTHSTAPMTDVARVVLSPLDEGRSRSAVYRMYAYTESQLQCINAVLKLSRPEDARREIDNYLNYVKWYLPYTWRVEQIGTAMLEDVGAICYSFAYNDERSFQSAAKYMRDGRQDEVSLVVERIFRPSFQRWYHERNVSHENGDLKQYYQRRWFEGRTDVEDTFRKTLRAFDQSQRNNVIVDGFRYPMPRGFLLGTEWGEYQSCIRHGDLHGGNVLMSDTGDLAFIDFQETGRGHVFEDFVTFEASLRLNARMQLDFEHLIAAENDEFKNNASSLPYSAMIQTIRSYAHANFPKENRASYPFALGLYCYRLLRIPDLDNWQREQLVACILATVRHLQDRNSKERS